MFDGRGPSRFQTGFAALFLFQGFDQSGKNGIRFTGQGQTCFERRLWNQAPIPCQIQLGADFTRGTFCYVEKMDKVRRRRSLESFGDVRHHRNGGATKLVSESKVFRKWFGLANGINQIGEFTGFSPRKQILKGTNVPVHRFAPVRYLLLFSTLPLFHSSTSAPRSARRGNVSRSRRSR